MSRREDIDNAIWSDPDFEALTLEATTLYLWSFTNPRCGMAGLYKVSHRAMTESKVPGDKLEETLRELSEAGFLFYESGVLFVRARVKHMRQRTEQIAKSIRTDLMKVGPDHPMRALWVKENARAPWLVRFLGDDWAEYAVPDGESHASLGGPSTDARPSGSLEPNKRGSPKGRSTLQGKGKGRGTGKGPLGRGAGEGTRASLTALARDEFPEYPPETVVFIARQIIQRGTQPTIDAIRAELDDVAAA